MDLIDFLKNFRYPEIDLERQFDGYVLELGDIEIPDYQIQGYIVFDNEELFLEHICSKAIMSISREYRTRMQVKTIYSCFVDFPHQTSFSKNFCDAIDSIARFIVKDGDIGYLVSLNHIPMIDKSVLYKFLWDKCVNYILKEIQKETPYKLYISENKEFRMKEIFLTDNNK